MARSRTFARMTSSLPPIKARKIVIFTPLRSVHHLFRFHYLPVVMFHFSSVYFSLCLSLSPSFFFISFFLGLFFYLHHFCFILLFMCPPHFSPSFCPSLLFSPSFLFPYFSPFLPFLLLPLSFSSSPFVFLIFFFCPYLFSLSPSPSFLHQLSFIFLCLSKLLFGKCFFHVFPLSLFLDLICLYLPCFLTSPLCNSMVLDLIFLFHLLFLFLSFSRFLISIHHFFVSFAFFLTSFFFTSFELIFLYFDFLMFFWKSPFRILICNFLWNLSVGKDSFLKQEFLFGKNHFFTSVFPYWIYFPYVPSFGLFFCALSLFGWLFPVRVFVIFLCVHLSFFVHFANLVLLNFFFLQLFFWTYSLIWVFFDLSFLSSFWLFVSFVFFLILCFRCLSLPLLKKKVLQIAFCFLVFFVQKQMPWTDCFFLPLTLLQSFISPSFITVFSFSNVFLTPKMKN